MNKNRAKGIAGSLTRKIGPLPVWAWATIVFAGVWYYRNRLSPMASGTGTGSVGPTPADPQQQTVLQPGESVYDPNTGTLTTSPVPIPDSGTTSSQGDPGVRGRPGPPGPPGPTARPTKRVKKPKNQHKTKQKHHTTHKKPKTKRSATHHRRGTGGRTHKTTGSRWKSIQGVKNRITNRKRKAQPHATKPRAKTTRTMPLLGHPVIRQRPIASSPHTPARRQLRPAHRPSAPPARTTRRPATHPAPRSTRRR